MEILLKLKIVFPLFIALIIALASFFTVCNLFSGMPDTGVVNYMSHHGSLNSGDTCCQNTRTDHALRASILETLTKNANFQKTTITFGLFVLAWYMLSAVDLKKNLQPKIYYTQYSEHRLDNYIFAALARGILQPKLYNI